MKYLFVSLDGLIADIAWSVVKEGHDVKFYIHDSHEKEIADGFVAKTDNWQADVDWADLVVFDDVLGQGTHAHRLRKTGKLVVGGTPYTDRLEDDRAFGQQELRAPVSPLFRRKILRRSTMRSSSSNRIRDVTSSNPAVKPKTTNACSLSGKKKTVTTFFRCSETTRRRWPAASRSFSCNGGSWASKSQQVRSSTAKTSSIRSV
jgi:hypothetical protein